MTSYTIVCELCGAKRKSTARPESATAPKLCRACHLDRQRVVMARMMKREPWPRLVEKAR